MKPIIMTRNIHLFIAFLFLSLTGISQEDAKAKAILDKASAKINALKTISIHFKVVITSPDGGDPITQSGTAHLSGDKYKIELEDQDIYCNGTRIVTHLKEDKEAYIGTVEDAVEEGSMQPNQMLTIWETGHNYRYVKETTLDGKAVHQIHLYPKDPGTKKYHTIIIKIDKEKNQVLTVFIKNNDGTTVKYILTKLVENPTLPDSMFEFDCAKHPEVDCIEE